MYISTYVVSCADFCYCNFTTYVDTYVHIWINTQLHKVTNVTHTQKATKRTEVKEI